MLVLGIETHPAASCPGKDPNVMRQMGEKLSPDNASRVGLKIVGAYYFLVNLSTTVTSSFT